MHGYVIHFCIHQKKYVRPPPKFLIITTIIIVMIVITIFKLPC